jgi:hypothetical protein
LVLAATSVADVKSTFDKLSPTQAQYVYKNILNSNSEAVKKNNRLCTYSSTTALTFPSLAIPTTSVVKPVVIIICTSLMKTVASIFILLLNPKALLLRLYYEL